MRRQSSHRLAAAALVALPLVLFPRAVLGDRVFFQRDVITYWMPQVETFVRVVTRGAWPLWDPYEGFGLPLLADPGSQALYPFTWLNLLIPPGPAYTLLVALHTSLAALGAWRLARAWGVAGLPATAAGVAFAASGPFVSAASVYHHLMGAAWMPWVLLGVEGLLVRGTRRDVWILGVLIAAQVLAGSGDMVILTAALAAVRVALAVRHAAPHAWRGLGIAVGLGLALSAAQWMPTLALVRGSSRTAMGQERTLYWSVHPASVLEFLVPAAAAPLPLAEPVRAALFESREPFLPSLYLGLTALCVVAAAAPGLDRRAAALGVLLIVLLLAAMGRHTPVLPLLLRIPGLDLLRYPVKVMVPFALAWAVLVALALSAWERRWTDGHRRFAVATATLTALLAVAAGTASEILRRDPDLMANLLNSAPGWRAEAVAPLVSKLRTAALLTAAATGLIAWRRRRPDVAPGLTAAALLLIAGDVVLAAQGVNALAPPELFTHRPVAAQVLAAHPAPRVYVPAVPLDWLNRRLVRGPSGWNPEWSFALGLQDLLHPPAGARWGIRGSFEADFTGLGPPEFSLLSAFMDRHSDTAVGLQVLRMAAVTHVVTLQPGRVPGLPVVAEAASVFRDPVRVHAVPDPLPRIRLVTRARFVAPGDSLSALGDPSFDPAQEVLLQGLGAGGGGSSGGTLEIVEDRPDRLRVETSSSTPAFLVVADAHQEGWVSRVDGRRVETLPANLLFRAVEVPAGRHRVEMSYRPAVLPVALGLTVAGLALLAFLVRRSP